jgi:DNA-binding CsgD family transcriptional regulator
MTLNHIVTDDAEADDDSMARLVDEATIFALGGQRCRIVCVDDEMPRHVAVPGSARTRQQYRPNEVAHFQLRAHRYALVADSISGPAASAAAVRDLHALLTNREMQIVQLICTGLLTKQISDRLRISEFTVRSYLKTIYCKLGVRSRGAMVYACAQTICVQRPEGSSAIRLAPPSSILLMDDEPPGH